MKVTLIPGRQAVIVEGPDICEARVIGGADELRVIVEVDTRVMEACRAQLDAADEALKRAGRPWKGTGRGRVQTIEDMGRDLLRLRDAAAVALANQERPSVWSDLRAEVERLNLQARIYEGAPQWTQAEGRVRDDEADARKALEANRAP